MGLLIIDPGLKLWGSERALLTTLEAVVAAEERVFLMAPPEAEMVGAVKELDLKVVKRPIAYLHRRGALAKLRFLWDIAFACLALRISRIHLNQAGPVRLVNIVAQQLGIPLIVHVRLREDVPRCAGLKASRRAPITLLFVSEHMRSLYPAGPPEPYKTLITVYDPYALKERPVPAAANGDMPFICVARLAALKRQHLLIEAVALAKAQGAVLPTRLLGADATNGAYERELRALAESLGVAGLIDFAGYSTDVESFMARSRFMILPSEYEPLGRVLFEAWDAGLVPICFAGSGGAAEVLSASGGGLIYPDDTAQSICNVMLEALRLSDAERLDKIAKGREWAVRNLSVDAYREKLQGTLFHTPREAKGHARGQHSL